MQSRLEAALDLVLELTTMLSEDMARSFERDGLSPARAHLLWVLQMQGPCPQRVLAEALSVSPRTVTGLVDGLEASGLVERRPHPSDRRATLVTLTDEGARIAGAMAVGKGELATGLFGPMDDQELGTFVAALSAVRDRLAAMIAEDLAARGSEAS